LAIRAESREGARLYRHYSIIFLPKVLFDYPGRIPRGQDHIDTTQKKGEHFYDAHLFFCYYSHPAKQNNDYFWWFAKIRVLLLPN